MQIRTRTMHDIAERGVAAHWSYEAFGGGPISAEGMAVGKQYRWLQELLDILEDAAGPEGFSRAHQVEMFSDQAFCFSPKGDVYALPRGSTPIDFAYAVHTEIGDHCVGAKINGRNMPLRTQLQNGDQVEILTSENQTPSPNWEHHSGDRQGERRASGGCCATSRLRQYVGSWGAASWRRPFCATTNNSMKKSSRACSASFMPHRSEELYALVGQGVHTGRSVTRVVFPDHNANGSRKSSGSIFVAAVHAAGQSQR